MTPINITPADVAAMLQGYASNLIEGLKRPDTVEPEILIWHVKKMAEHAELLSAMMKQIKADKAKEQV